MYDHSSLLVRPETTEIVNSPEGDRMAAVEMSLLQGTERERLILEFGLEMEGRVALFTTAQIEERAAIIDLRIQELFLRPSHECPNYAASGRQNLSQAARRIITVVAEQHFVGKPDERVAKCSILQPDNLVMNYILRLIQGGLGANELSSHQIEHCLTNLTQVQIDTIKVILVRSGLTLEPVSLDTQRK